MRPHAGSKPLLSVVLSPAWSAFTYLSSLVSILQTHSFLEPNTAPAVTRLLHMLFFLSGIFSASHLPCVKVLMFNITSSWKTSLLLLTDHQSWLKFYTYFFDVTWLRLFLLLGYQLFQGRICVYRCSPDIINIQNTSWHKV